METELQKLKSSQYCSMMIRDDSDIKYTSLKDVLSALECSPATRNSTAAALPSIHDFSSSTISIKNQLVKHAASAYLQSAAIIATRDQTWFTRLWRQIRRRRWVLHSRWQECARGPVGFYVRMIMRTVRRMVARAESRLL